MLANRRRRHDPEPEMLRFADLAQTFGFTISWFITAVWTVRQNMLKVGFVDGSSANSAEFQAAEPATCA